MGAKTEIHVNDLVPSAKSCRRVMEADSIGATGSMVPTKNSAGEWPKKHPRCVLSLLESNVCSDARME